MSSMQAYPHQTRTESLVNAIQDQTRRLELSPLHRTLPSSPSCDRIPTQRNRFEYRIGHEESTKDCHRSIGERNWRRG